MIKNKYKVPVKLWNSFKNDNGKNMYNELYEDTIDNLKLITLEANITKKQWTTIVHNFSCIAAWKVIKYLNNLK